ncbi:nuclease-like protein [uncultured Thiohalocapsa sp.]|uniref:thermonuclease family protein n=1 Tax=uncultured Thiohalocapsa sp. TaxID=768990 RepID=UPI0025FD1E69|nr:nuclease-like protein [uncultured Thiohalocapsa sp.]
MQMHLPAARSRPTPNWAPLLLALLLPLTADSADFDFEGHAIVRDDGSLLIGNRVVHLFGIYLPETNRQCRRWISPVRCGERGVLALDFIVQGFIRCVERARNADGSLAATCWQGRTSFDPGIDLAAYLIERGWALALPNAPFEYHAMERIARARELGVWGWPVDAVTEPRR